MNRDISTYLFWGDILHSERVHNGMTREEVAEILDVDPVTVWRWETCNSLIPLDKLEEYLHIFGYILRMVKL